MTFYAYQFLFRILPKKFHCDCGRTFRAGEHLLLHKELHCPIYATWRKANNYVDCSRCQSRFRSVEEMQEHLASCILNNKCQNIDRPYQCDGCAKTFVSLDAYIQHRELSDGCWAHPGSIQPKYDCKHCGISFTTQPVWAFHSGYCSGKKMDKTHLDWHRHGTQTCSFCQKHFKSRQSLKDHITQHIQESKFNCRYLPEIHEEEHLVEDESILEISHQLESQHLASDSSDREELINNEENQYKVQYILLVSFKPSS